ncbi:amidase/aspartyl-tRNA(Asn)/glutamyl-tRNA(Gln) amidotransferase subunit A [Antricoccus suffuscus]|uniref:Amidase/aspartyl-tRNA(Asn)/glutamyl-tRNA(Gln) amidotransferase subunit A n=1 Tax=Antricoccus suffuscus TaxID=1629062 RepID=A0A2T1A2R4_9ACTN|nr:amidase family protein [Antricoccus suffuscus]PRZ42824.1 amidase/aspartyl-tRNA(Asn)/glutamyl-tRNA(Gln) amidotransferase subunit A [Antricoccus suffuscus]
MGSQLWSRSATELGGMIRAREVLPSEILESVLARMDEHDPTVHAFITRTDDLARVQAAAADDRAKHGDLNGPMDGIPYSIKDLVRTAGIRTTMGSKFFTDNVPDEDSAAAARLRSSGGLLLGKTNAPNAGHKDMTDNLVAETTLNPWKLDRTSGGSSGGAAAAVASGFGPFAQGGDGAGSIRIPAALCGVVGFKPSFGRVSLYPYREYWSHRTHWGSIARTVADAAMMLSVLAGPDERDAGTIDAPLDPFVRLPEADRPLAGLKVRWSPDMGYGPVETEVVEIVQHAVHLLGDLGCVVEEASPGWENPSEFHRVLWSTSMAAGFGDMADEHPDWIESTLHALIDAGRKYSAVDLRRAEAKRGALYAKSVEMFEAVDFFVSPAMPIEAWSAIPGRGQTEIAGQAFDQTLGRAYLLYPFNLTGQPSISLPCGWTKAGLPVGIQIAGGWHKDIPVLQIAEVLERTLGLGERWPDLLHPKR